MASMQHALRKVGLTAAEQFWYVLGCVNFGTAYFMKVPVKKALSDYGLVEMTEAEKFWYVLGCVAFGSAYFMKVPVAKALSELEQFRVARAAPHDQLATFGLAAIQQHEGSVPLLEQDHKEFPKQDEHAPGMGRKKAKQEGKEAVRRMRLEEKAARDAKHKEAQAVRAAKRREARATWEARDKERREARQAARERQEMADPRFVQWNGATLVLQGSQVFEIKHQSAMSGNYFGYGGLGLGSMEMVDQAHPLNGRRVVIPASQIVGVDMLPGERRRLPMVQLHVADGREYRFVGRDVAAKIEQALERRGQLAAA